MTSTSKAEKPSEGEGLGLQGDSEASPHSSSPSSSSERRHYNYDQLMEMRFSPLSDQWPNFLDVAFKNLRGVWDPDRWHQGKREISPIQDPAVASVGDKIPSGKQDHLSNAGEGKSRREPKEARGDRVKAEQDPTGIVLIPQRRSFLTGCSAAGGGGKASASAASNTVATTPTSTSRKAEEISLRPADVGNNRRFGSGRILNRGDAGDAEDRESRETHHYDRRDERGGGFRRGGGSVGGEDALKRPVRGGNDPGPGDKLGGMRRRDYNDPRGGGDEYSRQRNDRHRGAYGPDGDEGGYHDRWGGGRRGEEDRRRDGGGRMGGRRHNDEPEWMSAEIDQDELMELHGFNDSPEKSAADNSSRSKGKNNLEKIEKEELARQEQMQQQQQQQQQRQLDQEFNIDDILHMDVIPGLSLILDDGGRDNEADLMHSSDKASILTTSSSFGGGRFSQFFQSSQQQQQQHQALDLMNSEKMRERRPSSQQNDQLGLSKNILVDGVPTVQIPENSSAYFAPISPAGKTLATSEGPTKSTAIHPNPLLNMLASQGHFSSLSGPSINELRGQKVHSVEELEANIRHMAGNGNGGGEENFEAANNDRRHPMQPPPPKMEMTAFEKFAAMVGGDVQVPAAAATANPRMQLSNQPFPGREVVQHANIGVGLIRPSPLPANAPTESDILAGMSGPRPMASMQPPPAMPPPQSLHDVLRSINNAPFDPNVLSRPEAFALMSAINSGQVTFDTLLQQYVQGDLPPLQRQILLMVLKVSQSKGQLGQVFNQPAAVPFHGFIGGFNPPQSDSLAFLAAAQQQQQQQQRLSPGFIGGGPSGLSVVSPTPRTQRIPSPQELVAHTQQILQNALIKQKLAEQRENFRRRHEGTPSAQENAKLRGTNSPLAFAPTAVMKKIAAERRDSDPNRVLPELKLSQNPAEKAGNGGAVDLGFSRVSPQQQLNSILQMHQQQQQQPQHVPNQMLIQHLRMQQQQQHGGGGGHPAQAAKATSPTSFLEQQQRLIALQQREMLYQQQQQQQQHHHHHMQLMANMELIHGPEVGHPPSASARGAASAGQEKADLARFFTSEMLAQVTSGNAPAMPPIPTQKALTLGEIERQAASVRM